MQSYSSRDSKSSKTLPSPGPRVSELHLCSPTVRWAFFEAHVVFTTGAIVVLILQLRNLRHEIDGPRSSSWYVEKLGFDPRSPSAKTMLSATTPYDFMSPAWSKPSMASQALLTGLGKGRCGFHSPEVGLYLTPYHDLTVDWVGLPVPWLWVWPCDLLQPMGCFTMWSKLGLEMCLCHWCTPLSSWASEGDSWSHPRLEWSPEPGPAEPRLNHQTPATSLVVYIMHWHSLSSCSSPWYSGKCFQNKLSLQRRNIFGPYPSLPPWALVRGHCT